MIVPCPNCGLMDRVEVIHGSSYGAVDFPRVLHWCPTGALMCLRCVPLPDTQGAFEEPEPFSCTVWEKEPV